MLQTQMGQLIKRTPSFFFVFAIIFKTICYHMFPDVGVFSKFLNQRVRSAFIFIGASLPE
jgi:hypothetical protein